MGVQDALAHAVGALPEGEEPNGYEPEEDEFGPDEYPDVAGDSLLGALRARAAALREETTVDLPLPGWQEKLWGRYKAVSISRFYTVQGGELRNPLTDWGPGADALASGLVGLYVQHEDGELAPLGDGHEVRYDDELVELLGLHVRDRTARSVLVALCGGGAKGETAVWFHFMAYQSWLADGGAQEVAESAVGESSTGA